MKLNINIIKSTLEAIEESDIYPDLLIHAPHKSQINILNPDVSLREIAYHLERMIEAGLVDAHTRRSKDGVTVIVKGLTIEGHGMLDNMRNETVWKQFRHKLEVFKSFSLDIAKTVLTDIAKKTIVGFD